MIMISNLNWEFQSQLKHTVKQTHYWRQENKTKSCQPGHLLYRRKLNISLVTVEQQRE